MSTKIKFNGKNYTAILKFLMTHTGDRDDFSLVSIDHDIALGWYFNFYGTQLHETNRVQGYTRLYGGESIEFKPKKNSFIIHKSERTLCYLAAKE